MNRIIINKQWDFLVSEFHNEKPNGKNLIKREILLILQVILTKISWSKEKRKTDFLKSIYNKTKEKYISKE